VVHIGDLFPIEMATDVYHPRPWVTKRIVQSGTTSVIFLGLADLLSVPLFVAHRTPTARAHTSWRVACDGGDAPRAAPPTASRPKGGSVASSSRTRHRSVCVHLLVTLARAFNPAMARASQHGFARLHTITHAGLLSTHTTPPTHAFHPCRRPWRGIQFSHQTPQCVRASARSVLTRVCVCRCQQLVVLRAPAPAVPCASLRPLRCAVRHRHASVVTRS
jgi:hypothetical protein